MFENPAATFHHQVLDAYDRYRSLREARLTGSNRLLNAATNLAVALNHYGENFSEIAGVNADALPRSAVVEEVANAVKHGRRRGNKVRVFLNRSSAIKEYAFITEYTDSEGTYQHADIRAIVQCLDGSELDLDVPLIDYLNAWISYLHAGGYIADIQQQSVGVPGSSYVERAAAKGLGYEVNRQVGLNATLKPQRFDPSQGKAVPIDMTGSTARFRVFQPRQSELVVTLSAPKGGPVLKATVKLTRDEASRLEAATALGLRDSMVEKLASDHRDDLQTQFQSALRDIDKNKVTT